VSDSSLTSLPSSAVIENAGTGSPSAGRFTRTS
jgi:hypothetical protein